MGGNIEVNSAATITTTAVNVPGLTATTNLGYVTIVNSGAVTSDFDRGIYADGNYSGTTDQTVSVTNTASGVVNANLAGIRAIDYRGLAQITNQGTVNSTLFQALIAWSNNGDASINNSGVATTHNDNAVYAATETGNATVINSGTVTSYNDPSLDAAHALISPSAGYSGLRGTVDISGDVEITNTSTGVVTATRDSGILAETPLGNITVTNNGQITGATGIVANSGMASGGSSATSPTTNGSITVTNTGTVTATGLAVSLDGTTNALTNSGTISTSGTVAVQTGDGNTTIVNTGSISAGSASDTAVSMGAGTNLIVLSDTATLVGKVVNASSNNTIELTGSGQQTLSGSIGAGGQFQGFANLTKTGSGTWLLDGTGSTLSGTLAAQAGTLVVNGSVNAGTATIGSASAGQLFILNGGDFVSANATIGATAGVSGTVNLSGAGSSWSNTYDMTVGSNGGQGLFTVSEGATLTTHRVALSTASWEAGSGGSGTMIVSGAGTVWNNDGGVDVARTAGSTGVLQITDGAVAHLYGTGIYTGAGAQITISGAGTLVEVGNPNDYNQAAWLSPEGGSVTVSDGASLYTTGTYVGAGGSDLTTMTVSGAGTTFVGAERIYVGGQNGSRDVDPVNGNGQLFISDGATAWGGTVGVGMDPNSQGVVVVTGAGSQLWAKANNDLPSPTLGNFYIGYNGTGTVVVSNGASIKADNEIRIAYDETGTGTLVIGAPAGSAATAAGTVDAPRIVFGLSTGSVVFNHTSADFVLSAAISGPGSIAQIGSGTTILTGDSTYTGSTTISAGTLQLGNGGTSGSILGDVTNNGTLAFNRSDDVTFAGVISGSGALVQSGTGTLTLTGANTYTGGTTISAGTLQLGNGGTTGSILGDVADNGTLAFNRSDDVTFAGVISGSGALVQSGTGTLTLTGANTYTGGTTVSAGTLVGNTTSLQGNIVDNAAVVFSQTTTGTYAGAISGTGSMTKTGAGTLILIGENTYTGGTTISEGTLQIGNGGTTGSLVGVIVNNAALVFNRSDTYNFPGTITGPGSVTIIGGTVNFTGANAYTGPIAVADATFELAPGAVSASSYTIGAGGVIGGTGTIGGLSVLDGGTASPGYSPGTLTVNGNVTFGPGSVYRVDVYANGAHDLIIASGTATITGGTVEVIAQNGYATPLATYTILTAAGGVTGQFAAVSSNFAFLTPSLTYDANDVYLTLARNDVSFPSLATTTNQKAAATAAQSLGLGNAVYDAVLQLSAAQAPAAFDALSGEIYASASSVMQQQSSYLREAIGTRVRLGLAGQSGSGQEAAKLAPGYDATVWTQAYGGWGQTAGDGNTASVDRSIGGFFTGIDAALTEAARLGIVGGYSRSTFNVDGRSSSGDIDNYDVGLYGGAKFGALSLFAAASYTWHDLSVDRTVAFSGFSGVNSADYKAGTTQVFGEAAWRVDLSKNVDAKTFGAASIEPFANLAYVNLSSNNFTETGSAAALTGSAETENTLYSTLGVRAATVFQMANGAALTPHASLGWQHAFGDVNSSASLAFVSGGSAFSVAGVPIARDAALVGAGVDYAFSKSVSASVTYSGQFGSGTEDNAFKGTINIKF